MYYLYFREIDQYKIIDDYKSFADFLDNDNSSETLYPISEEKDATFSIVVPYSIYKKHFEEMDPTSLKKISRDTIRTLIKSADKQDLLNYLLYSDKVTYIRLTDVMSKRLKESFDETLEEMKKYEIIPSLEEIKSSFNRIELLLDKVRYSSKKRGVFEYFIDLFRNLKKQETKIEKKSEINYKYLEEYSLSEWIQKLIHISTQTRKYEMHKVLNYMNKHEELEILRRAIELLKDNNCKHEEIVQFVKESKEHYLQTMQEKFTFIKKGFDVFFNGEKDTSTKHLDYDMNLTYKNSIRTYLQEYTIKELNDKFIYYYQKSYSDGILSTQADLEQEKNSLLKSFFEMVIDGCDLEDLIEYIELEECSYMRHFDLIFKILEIGLKGLADGNNPRVLESKLLTFIEPKYRKSIF